MRLIVISSPDEREGEIEMVHEMFVAGLKNFHLRKPKFSTNRLRRYLDRIDPAFRTNVVIHTHHELSISYKLRGIHLTEHHRKKRYWQSWLMLKYLRFRRPELQTTAGYHTLGSLKLQNPGYTYVFLSPVFDSISKLGYKSTFNEESLKQVIRNTSFEVIALGGVDENKIDRARELGFHGVGLLGGLWRAEDPVEKFKRIQQLCLTNVPM